MPEQAIEGLLKSAMENIRGMVDVNTVVGDPVETPDGMVIIPISRVSCGFAAGGGEYAPERTKDGNGGEKGKGLPFAGGSGAGISVQPVGFLVVGGGQVRLLSVDAHAVNRILDLAPELMSRLQDLWGRKSKNTGGEKPKGGVGGTKENSGMDLSELRGGV